MSVVMPWNLQDASLAGILQAVFFGTKKSADANHEIIEITQKFISCSHETERCSCQSCFREYHTMPKTVGDDIPTASRLGQSIGNASLFRIECISSLHDVACSIAEILQFSYQVRSQCLQEFYAKMSDVA